MEDNLNIENIKISEGNEISFCPFRGGIINSLKLQGKEILYLDENTFQNLNLNVRGGIPILFPNTGIIESEKFPNLPQHGFARNSTSWKLEKYSNSFKESLLSDEESIKSYPYHFSLSIEGKFEDNSSFTISQNVQNLEKSIDLPISMGLHPYFKVLNKEKSNIQFNFEGGEYIKENINLWSNGQYISIDNPKIKDNTNVMEIIIPDLGTLVIDASEEYSRIWIWSLPDKDFICIEPVMRDVGGLIDNPRKVRPGETFSAKVNFNLLN